MPTTRESLEAALAADPENVALHSAYADFLIEEGDPRGEYIRLELANPDIAYANDRIERSRLEQLWLGPLLEFRPIDPEGFRFSAKFDDRVNSIAVHWSLGWIERIVIARRYGPVADMLGTHPYARLLRGVYLLNTFHRTELTANQFERILSDLQSLPIREWEMSGFRVLGDDMPERLIRCGMVQRLQRLKLSDCGLTDDGAISLANSPRLPQLKDLNLDNNHLSPIGVAALAEVGFVVGKQRDNPGWNADAD